MPVDEAGDELPVLVPGVVVEVGADLCPPVQPGSRDEVEAHVVGEHVADRVEVAGIETVDIAGEAAAFRLGEHRQRMVVGFARELAEAYAAAMQVRLHRGNARVEDAADLVKGIAEHVHQDDAAALAHRQAHQGAQAGGGGLAAFDLAIGVGDRFQIFRVGLDALLARAPAQQIQ